MTSLLPYITFQNTKEALEYYQDVFGATNIHRLAVSSEQASQFNLTKEEAENATMHAEFSIANTTIHASDGFGKSVEINGAISLMIAFSLDNEEDASMVESLYQKLENEDSVKIEMPFKTQFWGGKMGVVTDRYGIRWMLHGQA